MGRQTRTAKLSEGAKPRLVHGRRFHPTSAERIRNGVTKGTGRAPVVKDCSGDLLIPFMPSLGVDAELPDLGPILSRAGQACARALR